MKNLVLALLLLAPSVALSAPPHKVCSDAGLEEDTNYKVTYNRDIAIKTKEQIKELPVKIKQQLIVLAKWAIKDYSPSGETKYKKASDIKGSADAVAFIKLINENPNEEINVAYLTAKNGGKFTKVTFYPGAQVGAVFIHDTVTRVAEISDGDVMCVKDPNKKDEDEDGEE